MHFLKTDFCYHQVLLFEDNYTRHLNMKHQLQLKTYACFHLSTSECQQYKYLETFKQAVSTKLASTTASSAEEAIKEVYQMPTL